MGEESDEEKADEDMKEYVDEADHEGEGEDEDWKEKDMAV